MGVFRYQAIDSRRATVKGTVAADTPRQAREELRARGLRVRQLEPVRAGKPQHATVRMRRTRHAAAWAVTIHELTMLLDAGIPLLEALDTVVAQYRGGYRAALLEVRERVAAGAGLAEALRQRPDIFDRLSVNLVEVGEHTGELDRVLRQLAEFKQRQLHLKDQVLNALAYPLFLVVFGTAATVFLMTYVMPPLLENLEETLAQLPWPTRVVKACSDLLLEYGWLLALTAAMAVVGVGGLLRLPAVRRRFHRALLRLPGLGPLLLKQSLSRIALVLSSLLRSGMVLTQALELASGATRNLVLRDAIEACRRSVMEGKEVASALERAGVFPPMAIRIFSVGQETGRLEEMLDQLADDYQRQVATSSARFAALLEPVLIVALAIVVGFVLVATILPILEAGNVL